MYRLSVENFWKNAEKGTSFGKNLQGKFWLKRDAYRAIFLDLSRKKLVLISNFGAKIENVAMIENKN